MRVSNDPENTLFFAGVLLERLPPGLPDYRARGRGGGCGCPFVLDVKELADVLAQFSLDTPGRNGVPPVRMMSFSWLAVRRMQRLAPQVPTVFLMDRIWWPYRDGSLPPGVAAAGPSINVLRRHPNYVQRVHAAGGQVHVWTVDEKNDLDLCREQGVDVVISNRPGRLLQWLDD